ncbi:MAG: septal ring lytic transglycosylase RlpA family protein [Treponema sp.]|nr:septal ring lytic transglycosylase RlpA family protein [Treponema sp.]
MAAVFCAAQIQQNPENGAFRQEGIASWYGAEFEGRPTASGELFDPSQFTAAHPSLPFGTVLRITNKHNDKQVTVRVNDRGPFVSARIIDLSRAAAEVLDMISTGTAPVLVEKVPGTLPAAEAPAQALSLVIPHEPVPGTSQPGTPEQPVSQPVPGTLPARVIPAMPKPGDTKRYRLQVGSYKIARNAVDAFDKLKTLGLNPAYERYEEFFRVVLAGLGADEIESLADKLGSAGFQEALLREER